jgi:hypothetical protein
LKIYNFLNPENKDNFLPNNYMVFGTILLHFVAFLSLFLFPRELIIESRETLVAILFVIFLVKTYLFYCVYNTQLLFDVFNENHEYFIIIGLLYVLLIAIYIVYTFVFGFFVLKLFGVSFLIGFLIAIAIFLFYRGIKK